MKKALWIFLVMFSLVLYAQDEDTQTEDNANVPETGTEETSYTGTAVIGGVTIDGKNYQQLGMRLDIPLGKLGFGVDIQLLIDEEGNIRKEDWDEFEDYLDKIYYVRWARKGDPFYIRLGGLDYSYLGYNIIVDGYSNMIEYPAYKRLGMEMSFETEKFGGELLVNNYKELITDKPGLLIGTRAFYKVWGDLAVGATFAADLNEYNGLRDNDDDGYPNEIDRYPEEEKYATDYDYYLDEADNDTAFVDQAVAYGIIDGLKKEDLENFKDRTSSLSIWGLDIGYPIYKGEFARIDIYGQMAQIDGYGWGFSAPAFRIKSGPFIFRAEYRQTDGEFLFGYFNPTYEMERSFYNAGTGTFWTKQDILDFVPALSGYFVGMHFDGWGIFRLSANYQDMTSGYDDSVIEKVKSLTGEFSINEKLIPKLAEAKAYYMQNNVEDFKEWKTPSTVMGYTLGYNIAEGTAIYFDYRYTFQDMDGNGEIKGKEETIKTISVTTKVMF
ncbi:MAG: hypothetical protein JXN63_09110 [Candidatus Delongbacteria bacterium]|nr:hypothetical protein [Candidatus Delongbacteria bacterium]